MLHNKASKNSDSVPSTAHFLNPIPIHRVLLKTMLQSENTMLRKQNIHSKVFYIHVLHRVKACTTIRQRAFVYKYARDIFEMAITQIWTGFFFLQQC